ncbi:hypothetical protein [Streptomyces sp. NPDC048172]|uniref:SWIM zinc finger family protein n=1 Tax=Streptomyces sp. NPDC048172 TaxID=3365505 RepID=UPI003721A4F7
MTARAGEAHTDAFRAGGIRTDETRTAKRRPDEARTGEARSGEARSGEARSGEVQSGVARSGGDPSGEAQSAEVRSGEARSGLVAAWLRALEEEAPDPARLTRGRAYARDGGVDAVRIGPGRLVGFVHGSRPRPYRASLRLPELTPEEWDTFLGLTVAEPAHTTALLDRELPPALAGEARAAGVRLLPEPGELRPGCSCPDPVRPCKHAAALGYEAAALLDADPFVLLLLRGRPEAEVRGELKRRQRATGGAERPAMPTVPARTARAARETGVRPRLPEPLPVPEAPAESRSYPAVPGGPSPDGLEFLASDAAVRAHAALAHGEHPLPSLSVWHDTIRLAATHPRLTGRRTLSPLFASFAKAAGRTPQELTRAAAAWRQGGETGLQVLEEEWDPPAGGFDRARGALAAAGRPRMTIRRNRLTDPSHTVQLRYGKDGRWYPYRSDPGEDDWWPEGPAADDPVRALDG